MKVILYRNGRAGELVTLLGEYPEMELEDLLGGATEMLPLSRPGLTLVRLRDGEEYQLPIRYTVHELGREPEPVAGDCAVIRMDREGRIHDARREDLVRADDMVRGRTV